MFLYGKILKDTLAPIRHGEIVFDFMSDERLANGRLKDVLPPMYASISLVWLINEYSLAYLVLYCFNYFGSLNTR